MIDKIADFEMSIVTVDIQLLMKVVKDKNYLHLLKKRLNQKIKCRGQKYKKEGTFSKNWLRNEVRELDETLKRLKISKKCNHES